MTCTKRARSYWTTCTCADCQVIDFRARKAYRNGRRPDTEGLNEAAWSVLDRWVGDNWSTEAIQTASHLPKGTISRILAEISKGHRRKFGPGTAWAFIQHGKPTSGFVGAEVTVRKLRALAVIGHSVRDVAAATGVPESTVHTIRAGRTHRVSVAHADAIDGYYDSAHMTPGTCAHSRRFSAKRKWVAPLGWEDITDTTSGPLVNMKKAGRKSRRAEDFLGEIAHLRRSGLSDEEMARRLGVTVKALEKVQERHKHASRVGGVSHSQSQAATELREAS